jgi:predicted TPR repeat methyltransferase
MRSSGDLLADRRYAYAEGVLEEGDATAAADLARQTLELAPSYGPAWFLLGKALEIVEGGREEALAAYREALRLEPGDSLGAGLRLAALGALEPAGAMSPDYVRALFDEYAVRFDRHLRRSLAYRGPELLHDAVRRACSRRLRPFAFELALDLGCGTGLAAELFRPECRRLAGVDLSPAMVRKAAGKHVYDELASGDLLAWLRDRPEGGADLSLAADVFVYVADLAPVFAATWRALKPGGLFAFTVQAQAGEGVVLGDDQRFAHGERHLRDLAAAVGLMPVLAEAVSTRQERGQDVPGLLFVFER